MRETTPPPNFVRTGPRGASPALLIHGVGLDLTYWDHQIDALSASHDVVAFDLPGHGRFAGGPGDWTFDKAVAAIATLIDTLDTGPVHLVGISFGGMPFDRQNERRTHETPAGLPWKAERGSRSIAADLRRTSPGSP